MKKIVLIICIVLITISCGSTKVTNLNKEIQGVELLNIISKLEKEQNYSIKIPEIWKPYINNHGNLEYTIKESVENYYRNSFSIKRGDGWLYEDLNLESYSDLIIENGKRFYYNYKYELNSKNTKFGKMHIINSSYRWKSKKYKRTTQIYEYKEKLYILTYSAFVDSYDKYIDEVEDIFSSFEITE